MVLLLYSQGLAWIVELTRAIADAHRAVYKVVAVRMRLAVAIRECASVVIAPVRAAHRAKPNLSRLIPAKPAVDAAIKAKRPRRLPAAKKTARPVSLLEKIC